MPRLSVSGNRSEPEGVLQKDGGNSVRISPSDRCTEFGGLRARQWGAGGQGRFVVPVVHVVVALDALCRGGMRRGRFSPRPGDGAGGSRRNHRGSTNGARSTGGGVSTSVGGGQAGGPPDPGVRPVGGCIILSVGDIEPGAGSHAQRAAGDDVLQNQPLVQVEQGSSGRTSSPACQRRTRGSMIEEGLALFDQADTSSSQPTVGSAHSAYTGIVAASGRPAATGRGPIQGHRIALCRARTC